MALLLCHECYCWVEPVEGRCPECAHGVDASIPDPAPSALEQTLGRIVARLGEVRVQRKNLPDRGTLFATTTGLLFLPHELDRVTRMVDAGPTPESLAWSLASLAWAPLQLLSLWPRKKQVKPIKVRVLRPVHLAAEESQRLPELLMQNPGVFFVPRKSIRTAVRRFRGWRIDRSHGGRLKLRPEINKVQFHRQFARLFAAENWERDLRPGQPLFGRFGGMPLRGSVE